MQLGHVIITKQACENLGRYKHDHKTIQEVFKNTVHQVHKHCKRICQSEWHHQELIMSIPGPEGCFLCILFLDLKLMVA